MGPHWTLARPAVSDPRWYPPTGYRVAYLSGDDLRVVAGDGTGDRLLAAGIAHVAPAWRPGYPYQLAYLTGRHRVVVRDADTGRTLWSANPGAAVVKLAWTIDGQRLLALAPTTVRVYGASGVLTSTVTFARNGLAIDGALSPDGRTLALVLGGTAGNVVTEDLRARDPTHRRVLTGRGLRQLDWSPDGRWLLVSWPAANQWVFVRVVGAPRIEAVSRIAQQFSTGTGFTFPQLDGWCCTPQGAPG